MVAGCAPVGHTAGCRSTAAAAGALLDAGELHYLATAGAAIDNSPGVHQSTFRTAATVSHWLIGRWLCARIRGSGGRRSSGGLCA
ncbi:hypothetical protein, partial [Paenibacillus phytohabitans]|uniref:hypothetical protein n=1 Tax=Paenibacillus phytohabitans TaxID=2654978 RepID=UPI001C10D1B8